MRGYNLLDRPRDKKEGWGKAGQTKNDNLKNLLKEKRMGRLRKKVCPDNGIHPQRKTRSAGVNVCGAEWEGTKEKKS